ncbi:MAG TPA: hypothetical protein VF066_01070 [Thermoleophilaceae bacterium]
MGSAPKRLVACCVIAAAAATAPAAQAATFGDAAGLHIVSVKQQNPRLVTLVATTKALPRLERIGAGSIVL